MLHPLETVYPTRVADLLRVLGQWELEGCRLASFIDKHFANQLQALALLAERWLDYIQMSSSDAGFELDSNWHSDF